MTILITGVAGFIASNFAHYIAKNYPDYHIIGVDKLSAYSNRNNISELELKHKLTFYHADITDNSAIRRIYEYHRPDYVVNFAAESHNDRAILDPTLFVYSNVLGAQTLLELSRTVGVRRHVHISTIEVYGEQASSIPFFTEDSPLNAKTPYSASKAAADSLVRAYMQTYQDMDICLTHCANNYGPYQFPEKLVPLAITNLLRGRKVPLYGDGLQRRDWLHVLDHCRGIDIVLHMKNKPPITEEAATFPSKLPIYDFSARQEMTNKDLIKLICAALKLDFHDSIQHVADRPNHDRRYLINPQKSEQTLGFSPSVPLDKGIIDTVNWYIENRYWWEDILRRTGDLQIDWSAK